MAAATDGFVSRLRAWGVPAGLSEVLDAAAALGAAPSRDREFVRYALAATLVKSRQHRGAFELAFDDFFPGPAPDGTSRGRLPDLIASALADDDQPMLRFLADQAAVQFAGVEPGRVRGTSVYLMRTLRALRLDDLSAAAVARAQDPGAAGGLSGRLLAAEIGSRADWFSRQVEAAIRRRMIAELGREAVQDGTRRALPVDIELVFAQPAELRQLREMIPVLSRKLQWSLQRARRPRRELDFRRTIRGSLATGGSPARLAYRKTPPPRPELVILADVSGSVAQFAAFTLYLVHALSRHLGRVRSYAFVDGIEEVTGVFEAYPDPVGAAREITADRRLIWFDGHSDYGHALESFHQRWRGVVTPRTTVLILGDGRSNYRDPGSGFLRQIARRAAAVHWLNPEPAAAWGVGDSAIADYRAHCTSVTECRTFRQLAHFIQAVV